MIQLYPAQHTFFDSTTQQLFSLKNIIKNLPIENCFGERLENFIYPADSLNREKNNPDGVVSRF